MERRSIDDAAAAAAELLRDPVWKVVMVTGDEGPCDECGTVGDADSHAYFAYSVGLHDWFGLPEVHCPGLSTGDDPVPLGLESLGETVNSIAALTVIGELRPGSTFEFDASDGHHRSWLRFTLGQLGPPLAVSAVMAHPEAMVIPVTWTVVETECPCMRRAS
jgi:hypothetical protein